MFIVIIAIVLFFCLLLIVDKNKNTSKEPVAKTRVVTKVLSIDQQMKVEKAEGIKLLTSTIKQLEQQKINQLMVVLETLKKKKRRH
ncbi:hypothetical protein UAY_00874 [Enterococcus moraviensis ATCC BAA-383]|uniref:Uncharacterized protein n=1 Tax=Enterococcus moraviensis ATCC BAA-383 TaxID=1158609 RepID=R2TSD6_9ENTE|nr:hypothetical protein [Enterococcus moraviensis]EOI03127.1 hypothetical protein UAY_00874 [Enterococcus moraviensis ATCC BAA-383]EOT73996.1 hypothetical protein I586_00992 [Enterococcus moraviensis ATCC BAA-383]